MDHTQLQSILTHPQARLANDPARALADAGLPSGLAYLALPLLAALAALDDPGDASDLLLELVGRRQRKPLLAALADPHAALRHLDGNTPLGQACQALVAAVAAPETRAALGVQMR